MALYTATATVDIAAEQPASVTLRAADAAEAFARALDKLQVALEYRYATTVGLFPTPTTRRVWRGFDGFFERRELRLEGRKPSREVEVVVSRATRKPRVTAWRPCPGEAHGPNGAFIDGCMVCLHHRWGFVPAD